jgi:hypothetical protein
MSFQPPFEQPAGRNPPTNNPRAPCWPDLGVQMDLNALWEYVNSLSQLHEGIRAQTQSVLHGVQTVQARAGHDSSSPVSGQVNGTFHGALPPNLPLRLPPHRYQAPKTLMNGEILSSTVRIVLLFVRFSKAHVISRR